MSETRAGGELQVWRFTDGRAGHENQTLGVARALARVLPCRVHDLPVRRGRVRALAGWLLARDPAPGLPDPDLLLGAGHATHLPLLAAARARGGRGHARRRAVRRVVLMRPSLPRRCFDLCIVPEHDGVPEGPGVLLTRGAPNAVEYRPDKDENSGLVLLGGPSAHCRWPQAVVVEQVLDVTGAESGVEWTVAGSRRTPPDTLAALRERLPGGVRLLPVEDTVPGWLAGALATAGRVWVSQDSVSMVYEALTAGAATGLLELPLAADSRVQRGIERLVSEEWVLTFTAWRAGGRLAPPRERLAEAERCARWMVEHWFEHAREPSP